MNYLAHLYLSGDDEGLIIGNYIADSVKGAEINYYSDEVQKGIVLHRKIDAFTDAHAVVKESKARLYNNYKKYAPVIVDIYYDYFLAKNWHLYTNETLNNYTSRMYALVLNNKDVLPSKSLRFTNYMIQYDLLNAYATHEGIDQVLKGMATRASFDSKMEFAIADLKENEALFDKEFKVFFPELEKFVIGEL
jgi:acyl carrier protein phosphodiesterase